MMNVPTNFVSRLICHSNHLKVVGSFSYCSSSPQKELEQQLSSTSNETYRKLNVAIIGYGTAGQAVAGLLGKEADKYKVTVFEQASAVGPVGAGFLLQPTGLNALQRMGLLGSVRRRGAKINALIGGNHKGRRIMDMQYPMWRPDSYGVGVQRHAIYTLLESMRSPHMKLVTGAKIKDVDSERGVIIDSTGTTHGAYDLIVVADGSHSHNRGRVFDAAVGEESSPRYEWGAWWCLIDAEGWEHQNTLQQRYHYARRMAGVLPVGTVHEQEQHESTPSAGGAANNSSSGSSSSSSMASSGSDIKDSKKLCIYWSMPADKSPDGRTSLDLSKLTLDLWPELSAQLSKQDPPVLLSHSTYRGVHLKRWWKHRTVFVGDAAHGMSPQLGQGVNLALMDALALYESLEAHCTFTASTASKRTIAMNTDEELDQTPTNNSNSDGKDEDKELRQVSLTNALNAYERERKRHVFWYRWASYLLTPVFQSHHDWLAWARDVLFHPASRMPVIKPLSLALLTGTFGITLKEPQEKKT